ncbi:MAG TPA: DMT family transporter [Kouleothrix sp.]|uniref:DMT family transporter n=1 Tax=Kouleothrix sp. TaxID=2779161 RepID=UPI002CB767F5|nr:DMT family transporter [Kouleothrix sp.]HRC76763.1 DMT family transporter [Kouleothrix sp.]
MSMGKALAGRGKPGLLDAAGPELAQLVVVGLWASTFIVTKHAFAELSPLAFTFVRFGLMTTLAFVVLAARRRAAPGTPIGVRRRDIPRFVAAGLAGYTFYQLGFVLGLHETSPFASSLLIAMVPLFTTGFLALRGERTSARGWAGLAIALAGVGIFLADQWNRGAPGSLLGDALSLGAAVSFALYGLVNRPLVRDYPPATYTAYTLLAGSLPLLALATPAALAQDWGRVSAIGWIEIVYMVVLPVYVAYMLWNWAIARRGAAAATSFSLLVPVASGTLSAWLFAEPFGAAKLLGAALVLGGLAIIRTPARRAEPNE